MSFRRAIIFLAVISLALVNFGCGIAEDYEGGSAIRIVSYELIDVATVTPQGVSGTAVDFTIDSKKRLGVGEETMDLVLTEMRFRVYDGLGVLIPAGDIVLRPNLSLEDEEDHTFTIGHALFLSSEVNRILLAATDGVVDAEDTATSEYEVQAFFTAKEQGSNLDWGDEVHAYMTFPLIVYVDPS